MARKHHHVVSRGLQRGWADVNDRVLLIEKTYVAGESMFKPVGVGDAFVAKHFSSVRVDGRYDDAVEDLWGDVENDATPAVRSWLDGDERPAGWEPTGSREGAKMLAALHFGRSYSFRDRHAAIAKQYRLDAPAKFLDDPRMTSMWTSVTGTPPTLAEVTDMVEAGFDDNLGSNSHFAMSQMARYYNVALDHLGPLHVQAVSPPSGIEFILGDSAFVLADATGHRVGGRELALKDATRLFLPLGPKLGALFTTSPFPDLELEAGPALELNRLSWRAAGERVIARPGADLSRSLGSTGWLAKVPRNASCPCASGSKAKACHKR